MDYNSLFSFQSICSLLIRILYQLIQTFNSLSIIFFIIETPIILFNILLKAGVNQFQKFVSYSQGSILLCGHFLNNSLNLSHPFVIFILLYFENTVVLDCLKYTMLDFKVVSCNMRESHTRHLNLV